MCRQFWLLCKQQQHTKIHNGPVQKTMNLLLFCLRDWYVFFFSYPFNYLVTLTYIGTLWVQEYQGGNHWSSTLKRTCTWTCSVYLFNGKKERIPQYHPHSLIDMRCQQVPCRCSNAEQQNGGFTSWFHSSVGLRWAVFISPQWRNSTTELQNSKCFSKANIKVRS